MYESYLSLLEISWQQYMRTLYQYESSCVYTGLVVVHEYTTSISLPEIGCWQCMRTLLIYHISLHVYRLVVVFEGTANISLHQTGCQQYMRTLVVMRLHAYRLVVVYADTTSMSLSTLVGSKESRKPLYPSILVYLQYSIYASRQQGVTGASTLALACSCAQSCTQSLWLEFVRTSPSSFTSCGKHRERLL